MAHVPAHVEDALAEALRGAATAGRWDVVAHLAGSVACSPEVAPVVKAAFAEAPAVTGPIGTNPAAAAVRSPELPASAAGVGWFCTTSTESLDTGAHASLCARTRALCDVGRGSVLTSGVATGPCRAQRTAACITFVDRLQQDTHYICFAAFSHCEDMRPFLARKKLDVSDISDCGPVK